MKNTKKIIALLLLSILFSGVLTSCSFYSPFSSKKQPTVTNTEGQSTPLQVIDKYMNALENGDAKAFYECLDPSIQSISKGLTNAVGGLFGISDAYDQMLSLYSTVGLAVTESGNVKAKFTQKEIKSSKISENSAHYVIEYNVEMEYEGETKESSGIFEFLLTKKSGNWYILAATEKTTETTAVESEEITPDETEEIVPEETEDVTAEETEEVSPNETEDATSKESKEAPPL